MNELLAYSYHHLFGVKSIGFRFFTVYGPWGRPDMAAYIFTDKMLRGQQITVYNEGKMKRDFTYIDDIVAGITASLDYKHDQPAVFNLGNNKPVEELYFVDLIAKSLGVKVNMRFEDSRAEIPITYANTTLANQELGFSAVTSIEQGIEKFISWYKDREKALIMCDSGCALIPNLCSTPSESATIAWEEVRKESRSLTASCETVVYSYSFSNLPVPVVAGRDTGGTTTASAANTNTQQKGPVCHIAFIYGASSSGRMEEFGSEWSTITIPSAHQANDLHEYSRILKISPGEFFAPAVKTAIFLDSRVKLKVQPEELVKYLDAKDGDGAKKRATLVVVKHPHIEDIYSWPTGRHSSSSSSRSSNSSSSSHAQLSMQLRAYQDYQVRNGYKYDNLFEVAMFVHDLQKKTPNGNGTGNDGGQSLRCDWYREAREWKPFAASSYQLAATFVLAKRRSEALALATKAKYEHVGNMKTEQEWIPVNFDPDSNLPQYVRVLPSHSHYTLYGSKKQR